MQRDGHAPVLQATRDRDTHPSRHRAGAGSSPSVGTECVPGRVADTELVQSRHEVVAPDRSIVFDDGDVRLPSVISAFGLRGQPEPLEGRELLGVPLRPLRTLGDEAVELRQLHEADGRLQIGHPVVEPELVEVGEQERRRAVVPDFLGDRGAVVAELLGAPGEIAHPS